MALAPRPLKRLAPRCWLGGTKRLTIDLSGVAYISSAGLQSILVVAKQAKAAAARLVVCDLTPTVAKVVEMSGFAAFLTVTPDRDEAIAILRE